MKIREIKSMQGYNVVLSLKFSKASLVSGLPSSLKMAQKALLDFLELRYAQIV